MPTNISERQLLRRLRELMMQILASESTTLHVVGIQTNARVLKLVVSAQEPMAKAETCYKLATEALDELEAQLKQEA